MESIIHNLKSLILSHHPLIVIETVEEDRAGKLLEELSRVTLWTLFDWSLASGFANRTTGKVLVQPNRVMESLLWMQDINLPGIFWFQDLDEKLDDPLKVRLLREIIQEFQRSPLPKSIVLTGENVKLAEGLRGYATHVPLQLPNRDELETILVHTVRGLKKRLDFEVKIDNSEKEELIRSLQGLTANQARQKLTYAIVEDGRLCSSDIKSLATDKAEALRDGGLLEYCPVDDNAFQLGGFDNLKCWLRRAEIGFSPEAASMNLRPPRGIMMVGVQGCGKSLAAKAIARKWGFPLVKLDAGRLFDKYVGESEKNLRKALQLAESLSPCVLWMDEVEKGFATGSGDSADGGTGRRLLGTFLTWMQENNKQVFLVGTANDLDVLPPEFLRKGRFDEVFFVDLPTEEERRVIFEIHLRLKNQNPGEFDFDELLEASNGFSGAEIEQAIIAALYDALYRKEPLDTATIVKEIGRTVPLSVSRAEDIAELRRYAQGRFVPVTTPPSTNSAPSVSGASIQSH